MPYEASVLLPDAICVSGLSLESSVAWWRKICFRQGRPENFVGACCRDPDFTAVGIRRSIALYISPLLDSPESEGSRLSRRPKAFKRKRIELRRVMKLLDWLLGDRVGFSENLPDFADFIIPFMLAA